MLAVTLIGSTGITWRNICVTFGTTTLIVPFIGVFFLPQSPRWLVSQGRVDDAIKSLEFYRGLKHDNQKELNDILEQTENVSTLKPLVKIKLLVIGSEKKNFLVLLALNIIYCGTGDLQSIIFSVQIFDSFALTFDSEYGATLCYVPKIFSCLLLLLIADRFGSKYVFTVSALLCAISMFALSIYHFLMIQGFEVSKYFWLPVCALLLFHGSMSINLSSLLLLRSELLPTPLRSIGVGIVQLFLNLVMFLTVSAHAPMFKYLGPNWTFFIYGLNCLITFIIAAIFVPETKDKSLEEITTSNENKNAN